MAHAEGATVTGKDGLRGRLESAVPEHDQTDTSVPVRLETGERIMVPSDLLARQKDGTYHASISFAVLQADRPDVRTNGWCGDADRLAC